MSRSNKLNWAVFDISTGFRLTDYATRTSATIKKQAILRDLPHLKNRIQIKQKKYADNKGV